MKVVVYKLNVNFSEVGMSCLCWAGSFFIVLDPRCIPALFSVNQTYSEAWREKLSLGVRQGEAAAGKRASPWERSGVRLGEPSPAQGAPTYTPSSPGFGRPCHRCLSVCLSVSSDRAPAGKRERAAARNSCLLHPFDLMAFILPNWIK